MTKLKILTIVGTRPEIIRLSRIIPKLDMFCDHILVHTGQNYDYQLNEIFFNDLKIRKPDSFLNAAGDTAMETVGLVVMAVDKVLEQYRPDAILLLGDTNSSLSAIAAKRRKIPIFHMEAGNRCFDDRVPEEINRRIVDHISDINLTYSDIAREYLLAEGIAPDQVIKTGSPMREVLTQYWRDIDDSDILSRLGLDKKGYFVVSFHREENVDSPKMVKKLLEILNNLAERYKKPIIFSTHPRTRIRLTSLDLKSHHLIKFMEPFGFFDYIKLQIEAHCVLSDSGTITEESSILNFPALNLREVNERPEGFEEGSVMMVGLSADRVMQCLSVLEQQAYGDQRSLDMVRDYSPLNVSDKVLRIILSYTNFVNQKVWKIN